MKRYIDQFYNEGLAVTFYLKPVNYLKLKIKNKKIQWLMIKLVKYIYTLVALSFAVLYIYLKLIKK